MVIFGLFGSPPKIVAGKIINDLLKAGRDSINREDITWVSFHQKR
jgi:hypothetical protein